MEFCVSLGQMFPPAVQVMAAYKLVLYLVALPQEKPTSEITGMGVWSSVIFFLHTLIPSSCF